MDWSNLTSGPGGSTVRDPVPIHAGISGSVFSEYAFDVVSSNHFLFILFYLKKQILTTTLTGYNFLNIAPNELILFPTSLKFNLVYFRIYLKKIHTTFCAVLKLCVDSNLFKIGIWRERSKLSKVLECTLPFHTLKASILNPGIIFCMHYLTRL